MKSNLFKTIAENISNYFAKSPITTTSKDEDNYFFEKFNDFLNIEDCVFCYQMIDEGYNPSYNSQTKLNKVLLEKIESKFYKYEDIRNIKSLEPTTKIIALIKYIEINSDYKYNYNIFNNDNFSHYDQYILDIMGNKENLSAFSKYIGHSTNNLKEYYASGMDPFDDFYHKTPQQNEASKQHSKSLLYLLSVVIKNDIYDVGRVQFIKDVLKEVCSFMESKTSERHKTESFAKIGKEYFNTFINDVNKFQAERLSKDNTKENVIKQLKSIKARQTTFAEEVNHIVINQEYSIENLPNEAKNKVKSINTIIKDINDKEVNEFVKQRVPVILKKYFSIDQEYRTTLKNVEGYNAEELMNQSLDNIERIVKAKKEDNNYDLISELSVENRKLRMR